MCWRWDVHLVLVLLTQLEAPVELALHDVGHGHDLGRPVCQGNRKGIAGRSRSPTATADQRDLGGVVVLSMNDGKGNSREGAAGCDFAGISKEFSAREKG